MKNIIVFVSFVLLFSCNNMKKCNDDVFSMSYGGHSTTEYECLKKIVDYGDTIIYQTMFDDYSDNSHIDEFLAYSLIMANKYDFAQAYYDVFYILTFTLISEEYETCLDETTRQFALDYFKQAIYKGNIIASERLLNEFGENQSYPIKELYLNTALIKQAKQNIDR